MKSVSQRQISQDIGCNYTNEHIYKTETDIKKKKTLWLPKGQGRGREKLGGEDSYIMNI